MRWEGKMKERQNERLRGPQWFGLTVGVAQGKRGWYMQSLPHSTPHAVRPIITWPLPVAASIFTQTATLNVCRYNICAIYAHSLVDWQQTWDSVFSQLMVKPSGGKPHRQTCQVMKNNTECIWHPIIWPCCPLLLLMILRCKHHMLFQATLWPLFCLSASHIQISVNQQIVLRNRHNIKDNVTCTPKHACVVMWVAIVW